MPTTSSGLHYVEDDLRPPWRRGGLPVLLHHGIGTNHEIWSAWIPQVAARHRTVRLDMRGFGRSPVPSQDHAWSLEEMTGDVWAVADAAGLAGPIHLVGESMGGTIVLAAAIARPARVASVTLSNGSYKGAGIGQLPFWRAQFEEGGVPGWGRRMMENRFAPGHGDPDALAWFAEEQAKTRAHVAIGLGGVLAAADLSAELEAFDRPLNVVLPDRSPFVPVRHGAEILELAPSARLRVVPGVRHGLPFSQAESEAASLVEYLARVEERGTSAGNADDAGAARRMSG